MASLEAKIVVLGSQGVGKTSLVHRYVNGSAPSPSTPSTIGASFLTKRVVDADTDTTVRLQIWDTAGQERFRSISRLYYRGANACILCYSIADETSFRDMGRWLTDLRRELGDSVILHVVGTKADVVAAEPSRRQVPFERCIAYVAQNLFPSMGSTPPPTASAHVVAANAPPESGYRQFLAGLSATGIEQALRSSGSKRSSGFWGQDVGWNCCHEISAASGEGVEEVFRVVTRKLVDQARKGEGSLRGMTPGLTPAGVESGGGFFDPRGSFRVRRDRRSWLGFPPGVVAEEESGREGDRSGRRGGRGCC